MEVMLSGLCSIWTATTSCWWWWLFWCWGDSCFCQLKNNFVREWNVIRKNKKECWAFPNQVGVFLIMFYIFAESIKCEEYVKTPLSVFQLNRPKYARKWS
jgi:hypothetical protein